MGSIDFLRNADLGGALASLKDEIRNDPSNPKHRIFLFQLLCVLGDWDKALGQLNVLRDLSADALSLVQTYQETLQCEALRSEVFSGRRSPLIFGEPEPWMAQMLEALKLGSQGNNSEAEDLRGIALEAAPCVPGNVTLFPSNVGESAGEEKAQPAIHSFEWVADADSRLGPFLEAIINGKYFWIPLQRIGSISLEKVSDLRDAVWLPARFQWSNGGETVGFVPTRYVGSDKGSDNHLRLARRTEWQQASESTFCGVGLRILTTDQDEFPLTSIQKIECQHE